VISPDYTTLVIFRGIVGFGVGGCTVPFDLLAEFLPNSHRGQFLMNIEYFWTLGCIFVVGFAWYYFPHPLCISIFLTSEWPLDPPGSSFPPMAGESSHSSLRSLSLSPWDWRSSFFQRVHDGSCLSIAKKMLRTSFERLRSSMGLHLGTSLFAPFKRSNANTARPPPHHALLLPLLTVRRLSWISSRRKRTSRSPSLCGLCGDALVWVTTGLSF
jgi:MFS family permease